MDQQPAPRDGGPLTLGILEAGRVAEPLAHRYASYPEMFRQLFRAAAPELALRYRDYAVLDGELPGAVDECDGYLITGSVHGVYEDLPWIAPLEGFLRATEAARRQLLGICFGHQILATALGGVVEKSSRGWGVGLHDYRLDAAGARLAGGARSLRTFALHQDQVIEPPRAARVIASSEFCPVAMMQIGSHVLTIQPHPEMGRNFAAEILELRRERIGAARTDAALASLSKVNDAERIARWLLDFLHADRIAAAQRGAAD